MKNKLPIVALIESGLTILYFMPIWWIVPWNTETIKVICGEYNRFGLGLAVITFLLSIIYLVVKKITKKTYEGFYIILCIFALILFPLFLMYSGVIFWFDVGFPRQH